MRSRGVVLSAVQFSLIAFGLILLLSQGASAQHILIAPPASKSGAYGPQSNMSARKPLPPRVMRRLEQWKRNLVPVAPVPSAKISPNIAMRSVRSELV